MEEARRRRRRRLRAPGAPTLLLAAAALLAAPCAGVKENGRSCRDSLSQVLTADAAAAGEREAANTAGRAGATSELRAGAVLLGRYHLAERLGDWPKTDPEADPDDESVPDEVLDGRYRNAGRGPLGAGAFGETWLAFDAEEMRQVAVKFVMGMNWGVPYNLLWASAEEEDKIRLDLARQECETARKIIESGGDDVGRSRITRCLDEEVESDHGAHLVFEVAGRKTLENVDKGVFSNQLTRIVKMLLEALQQLEHARYVHLDIKPANIMLYTGADKQLYLRLIDFGLAAPSGTSRSMRGSPGFAAPELFLGSEEGDDDGPGPPVTFAYANDVWSAGAALHYRLCGYTPNVGSLADKDIWQMHGDAVEEFWKEAFCYRLNGKRAGMEVYRVIKEMLHPNPRERRSASALLGDRVFSDVRTAACKPGEPFVGKDMTGQFTNLDGAIRKNGKSHDGAYKCCCPPVGPCLAMRNAELGEQCSVRKLIPSALSCSKCMPKTGFVNLQAKSADTNQSKLQCFEYPVPGGEG